MWIRIPVLAAVALGGCATSESPPVREATAACTREAPTGSSIPTSRCRSREEVQRDADAARTAGEQIDRGRAARPATVQ